MSDQLEPHILPVNDPAEEIQHDNHLGPQLDCRPGCPKCRLERLNEGYTIKARRLVLEYIKPKLEKTDTTLLTLDDIYIVWFSKTLQNWKALVSTTLPDGMYYEVTHNGTAKDTYIDVYKKFDNVCVPD
jgi:hypothetical protein